MSFLKKLVSLFTGGAGRGNRFLTIYVLSRRCNEPMTAEIDLLSSLSQIDDEGDARFFTRKVIQGSGKNRCFAQVEVLLWFDRNKNLLRHEIEGGRWLSEEEYAAELERFNAPPEEDENEETNEASAPEAEAPEIRHEEEQ